MAQLSPSLLFVIIVIYCYLQRLNNIVKIWLNYQLRAQFTYIAPHGSNSHCLPNTPINFIEYFYYPVFSSLVHDYLTQRRYLTLNWPSSNLNVGVLTICTFNWVQLQWYLLNRTLFLPKKCNIFTFKNTKPLQNLHDFFPSSLYWIFLILDILPNMFFLHVNNFKNNKSCGTNDNIRGPPNHLEV